MTATLEAPIKSDNQAKSDKPTLTFRLLAGGHIDDFGVKHEVGAIIKTHKDLAAMFGRDKFALVNEYNSPPISETKYVPLESMAIADLTRFAKDQGIDLKGAKDKDAVLRIVKAALLG